MKDRLKYISCGILAGIPNGFFGAGGGMILVPLFCRWVTLPLRTAFATSVAVILPMSLASAIIYLLNVAVYILSFVFECHNKLYY